MWPPIHTRWHVYSVLHPWLHTCLVSLVCDLPYIPGDTCIVRYIPGYTRVWYPWYVTPHTYQVTRVPRLHTYSWCVSGVLYRGFARVGYLGYGIQSYRFMNIWCCTHVYPRVLSGMLVRPRVRCCWPPRLVTNWGNIPNTRLEPGADPAQSSNLRINTMSTLHWGLRVSSLNTAPSQSWSLHG